MYKTSIPIISRTTNDENRDIYIDMCKRARADRVFIYEPLKEDADFEHLRENVRIFKENGFEVGIWTAGTVGHGGTVVGAVDSGEKP